MFRYCLVVTLCLGWFASVGWAEDKRANLEGKWERQQKGEDGEPLRIVKEHEAGRTTLTVYDEAGKVAHQHKSKYKLKETAQVRIFTYSDIVVTSGPNKGKTTAGPFSYVYRIAGDSFYEVREILLHDKGPPNIIVWKRVKRKNK